MVYLFLWINWAVQPGRRATLLLPTVGFWVQHMVVTPFMCSRQCCSLRNEPGQWQRPWLAGSRCLISIEKGVLLPSLQGPPPTNTPTPACTHALAQQTEKFHDSHGACPPWATEGGWAPSCGYCSWVEGPLQACLFHRCLDASREAEGGAITSPQPRLCPTPQGPIRTHNMAVLPPAHPQASEGLSPPQLHYQLKQSSLISN